MSERLPTVRITGADELARVLAKSIQEQLDRGKPVLWLLSGGSAIAVAVAARPYITAATSVQLHIGLVDERYVEPGHNDSNWQQIVDAGFAMSGATPHPILHGKNKEDTAVDYADDIGALMNSGVHTIALLGLGADGHTAGLKPGNPLMNATQLYASYSADDFERITATPHVLTQLDDAYIYAVSQQKWPAIERLLRGDEIPARFLREMPSAALYSDYNERQEG